MSGGRILLTGATGGLGGAVLREAQARGLQVRATGRDAEAGARLGTEFAACDLAAPDADLASLLQGCDRVIHAAALSASWGERAAFERANVEATRRLLTASRKAGVRRFVFISSPSIFASFRDQIGIGEHHAPAPRPLNHYAQTKLAAERLVLRASGEAMACCAIRPRALVGEGDRVILPALAALARRERMPLPRGGLALVELTDLRDAAWAICEAQERAATLSGRAINISGGKPVAVRDVAGRLAAQLGHSPRLVALPAWLAKGMARVMEGIGHMRSSAQEPPLTRYTLATLAYSQTFDPEPARRMLGFEPQYDALATLLAQAAKGAARGAA